MNTQPLVSLITVNYNQSQVTAELLQSLSQLKYSNTEMIVVDNASEEDAGWLKEKFPFITYVKSKFNAGFAGGNNLGLRYAKGKYAFFVNNDTEVTPNLVRILVDYLEENPQCGMACPKIKFFQEKEVIQYAGCTGLHLLTSRSYGIGWMEKDAGQHDVIRKTDLPHGAAMMVPMSVIREVGTMSDCFFLYYEELDWSARIKAAGYDVMYIGQSTIYHKESVSTGRNSPFKTYYIYRNRFLYIRRNYRPLPLLISSGFFLAVSVPVHMCKHALKKEWTHMKAIGKALSWNFRHVIDKNIETVGTSFSSSVAGN